MKIFIGNLNTSATEYQLSRLFSAFGSVEAAYIPKDNIGNTRGFGYVVMTDDEPATAAIQGLNKTQFMGQYLAVSEAIASVGYTAAQWV